MSAEVGQDAVAAVVGIAKTLDAVPHAVSQRQQQAVVGQGGILDRSAHAKIESASHQHERNVLVGVAVALAELVRPHEAEPDLVLRLGNRLFIIEAKYRSGKSGADADAATAEDDEVGEADGQSIQRALDQLAREWRSCVPTADGVFVGPAGLGAAVTECAYRALIYLVDGTRWKSAQKDIKESRDREPMGRLLLLTWQDLHIVIGAYLRGGQGPPREQRWLRHLQTLLENRGLRGFVGFPWDVVRACLDRVVPILGTQPRLRAKPGSVRRFAISFVKRLAIGRRLCGQVGERHQLCDILDPQTSALLARWPRVRAGALRSKTSNVGTS